MITRELDNFGNVYVLTGAEIEKYESLTGLFEEEEAFVLTIKSKYSLDVREDLLILFVQMYLLRFAIPYFQFTNNKFPDSSNLDFLKRVLYFCLTGRFVDDLVDKDSRMFKTYESILLFQKYYPRLVDILSKTGKEKFDSYLFDSTKYKSPVVEKQITLRDIRNDVYERIKYFFCESEEYPEQNQQQLKSYMGILLGGLDVNDLIADGYLKSSSTVVSNHVYHKYFNDEGKLLFDNSLLEFYGFTKSLFENESDCLIEYCNENQLFYTANILKRIKR
jgi:hypothetical protein